MPFTPTGEYYFGGGAKFLPRDFMKIGQLHVNGGTWNGHKIFSPEWSRRATTPWKNLGRTLRYGYLWWVIEYPYNGRTIRAFYAGGNGGQVVMGIPELDLVIAFYAGSYNDVSTQYEIQTSYIPKFILPSVEEGR
jgi:CubicO group peptidase (beta-lactamase class C family)